MAKGFNFPNLSLVGMVFGRYWIFIYQIFRSTERSFQLIVQMAGRAGRNPQFHSSQVKSPFCKPIVPETSLHFAMLPKGIIKVFSEEELKCRQQLAYPPYGRLGFSTHSRKGDR